MWNKRTRRAGATALTALSVGLLGLLSLPGSADARGAEKKSKAERWVERYSATAVGTGHQGAAAGRASRMNFIVERWTTAEERATILELLATNDGNKITKGLEKLDAVGRVQIPGQRGYDLRYAYHFESGDKRQIVLATDRPVASLDAVHDPGIEYLVAIITFELDASGKGTGYIAPALELHMSEEGRLEAKNSAADPITLTDVRKSQ
jgi:hypothetical protein